MATLMAGCDRLSVDQLISTSRVQSSTKTLEFRVYLRISSTILILMLDTHFFNNSLSNWKRNAPYIDPSRSSHAFHQNHISCYMRRSAAAQVPDQVRVLLAHQPGSNSIWYQQLTNSPAFYVPYTKAAMRKKTSFKQYIYLDIQ